MPKIVYNLDLETTSKVMCFHVESGEVVLSDTAHVQADLEPNTQLLLQNVKNGIWEVTVEYYRDEYDDLYIATLFANHTEHKPTQNKATRLYERDLLITFNSVMGLFDNWFYPTQFQREFTDMTANWAFNNDDLFHGNRTGIALLTPNIVGEDDLVNEIYPVYTERNSDGLVVSIEVQFIMEQSR